MLKLKMTNIHAFQNVKNIEIDLEHRFFMIDGRGIFNQLSPLKISPFQGFLLSLFLFLFIGALLKGVNFCIFVVGILDSQPDS